MKPIWIPAPGGLRPQYPLLPTHPNFAKGASTVGVCMMQRGAARPEKFPDFSSSHPHTDGLHDGSSHKNLVGQVAQDVAEAVESQSDLHVKTSAVPRLRPHVVPPRSPAQIAAENDRRQEALLKVAQSKSKGCPTVSCSDTPTPLAPAPPGARDACPQVAPDVITLESEGQTVTTPAPGDSPTLLLGSSSPRDETSKLCSAPQSVSSATLPMPSRAPKPPSTRSTHAPNRTPHANGCFGKEGAPIRDILHGNFDNMPQFCFAEFKRHLTSLIECEEDRDAPAMTGMLAPSMLISPAWREGAGKATELILKRKLERAKEGDKLELTLGQLQYSQESIRGFFCDGRPISKMLSELHDGEKTVSDIPVISAVVHAGRAYTLDNRRLWTFKHCGLSSDVRIPVVAGRKDGKFFRKYTTPTFGASLRRRSDDGFFPLS